MSSLLVLVCLALFSAPTSGHSQKKTPAPAKPTSLEVLWHRPILMPAEVDVAPWLAVGESSVFLAGPQVGLTAYDFANAEKPRSSQWMTAAPPVVIGSHVAVLSGGALVVLRQDRDEVVWRADLDPPAGTLFTFGNHLGVAAGKALYTWDDTGTAGWHAELTAAPTTPVVFANGALFVGSDDSTLTALDASTGVLRWRVKLPAKPESLAASPDQLYLSAANGHLYSYLTGTGKPKWDYSKMRAIGQPVVDAHQVYFTLLDNAVYAFERKGGSQRWSTCLADRPVAGPIRMTDRLAIALDKGLVIQVGADGQLLPATAACGKAASTPVTAVEPPSATLQFAAASPDGARTFTVTTAPDSKRILTAWGPKTPAGTPR